MDDPSTLTLAAAPGASGVAVRPRPRRVHALRFVQLLCGAVIVGLAALPGSAAPTRLLIVLAGVIVMINAAGAILRALRPNGLSFGTWLAIGWMTLIVGSALLEPLLPLGEARDTSATLRVPRLLRPTLTGDHVLGTNNAGLDLLARVVAGARTSLMIALFATALGLIVGGMLGIIAGYRRGAIDLGMGIATDVVLAFPPLVLLLAIASAVTPSTFTLTAALGLLTLPTYIRMARANTRALAHRDFIDAARSMGASDRRIMLTEVVPNVIQPLLSYGLVNLSVLIVAESALSFLGLGLAPPAPTWGNMIAEGNGGMAERAPHLVLVPGAVLFLTVLSLNLLGEAARKRWDPMKRAS